MMKIFEICHNYIFSYILPGQKLIKFLTPDAVQEQKKSQIQTDMTSYSNYFSQQRTVPLPHCQKGIKSLKVNMYYSSVTLVTTISSTPFLSTLGENFKFGRCEAS